MRWLALSFAVVLLDQLTKHWAQASLELHDPVAAMPFVNMTLTYNEGAAFSFLRDAGGWQRWLFIGLSLGVSVLIIAWLRAMPPGSRWTPGGLALILGGAVGNLWDRLTIGKVVDFIDVHYRGWHWPAFNAADSAICVGAALLIIAALRSEDAVTRGKRHR